MKEDIFMKFQSEEEDEEPKVIGPIEKEGGSHCSQSEEKECYLDPPREIPKRSYSLEPDMANGWKPKKNCKPNLNNVFSLNYDQYAVDELLKEIYKNKKKHIQTLVYLGPRKSNSFVVHQGNSYPNPYPPDKHLDQLFSARSGLPLNAKANECFLRFDADFESGNLDAVIQRGETQFDLYMRVDSNTRGHTNWYYFTIANAEFIGRVQLNICNFRREKSLYQRGLKPYVKSRLQEEWHQGGSGVKYEHTRIKYSFIDEEEGEEIYELLNACFTMSFSYDFGTPNDIVHFAYCVPYTYSHLLKTVTALPSAKLIPALKSLSGLTIPVLEVTDDEVAEYNKKVILVTGRIHPGESNSSFVAEGMLEFLCGSDHQAKDLRKAYIFYIVPMLNPDGVVAGNYRTSFFGKDLNRTFDQSRKYAFPQTFHLLQLVRQLKKKHKKRFCLYLDLHGHSVKKNAFMYGPDFGIQHSNYDLCRELPRLLSALTSAFRYYSCIFRIASEKAATGRAILNRAIDVPFTYTLESSNGFYYDSSIRNEVPFTAKKWKEIGVFLCKALAQLKLDQRIRRDNYQRSPQIDEIEVEKISDDQISEGKSDSEPEDQDLTEKQLLDIECKIAGKEPTLSPQKGQSPQKEKIHKNTSKEISRQSIKKQRPAVFLPPINTLNRAMIFSNRNKKKESLKQERLRNIQSQLEDLIVEKPMRQRLTLSQLIAEKTKDTVKCSSFHFKKEDTPKFRISK